MTSATQIVRPSNDNPASRFRLGSVDVDPDSGKLSGPGGEQKLDPKVMAVLLRLAREPGQVVSRNILMQDVWGDVVGDCDVAPCTEPQGVVDFVDITAVVDKFKNLPGAPAKSRVDVGPAVPDQLIDFVDIPWVVDGFRGLPYPFDGPDGCP